MTVAARTAAPNMIYGGILLTVLSIMMKRWLFSKRHNHFKTKMAENRTLWDRTCLYGPYKEYTPAPVRVVLWITRKDINVKEV